MLVLIFSTTYKIVLTVSKLLSKYLILQTIRGLSNWPVTGGSSIKVIMINFM